MHLRLQLSAGDPHSALGDLSEGLSFLRALAPRTALPVPPPGTGVRPAARRQARGVKPWVPVLKAFVAAGPARRALLNVRSPCELGSFLLTSFSAYFQKEKKIDVLSPPRTGTASQALCFLSVLCGSDSLAGAHVGLHDARSRHHHACQASAEPAWAPGLPRKFQIAVFGPERLRPHERPGCSRLSQAAGWPARALFRCLETVDTNAGL